MSFFINSFDYFAIDCQFNGELNIRHACFFCFADLIDIFPIWKRFFKFEIVIG